LAFSLNQNYPNPFNGSSKFKFEIAKSGHVRITVYDSQGKEVKTIVNEFLNPGTYEYSFNGNTLSSGVYFYKLNADGYSQTRRMVMTK